MRTGPNSTHDCQGRPVAVGDEVRILDINPDPDLDDDQREMFLAMIGACCAVERIDADGTGWVAVWWNGDDGTQLTLVGLTPLQMELQAG
jgi:hypothetical protein